MSRDMSPLFTWRSAICESELPSTPRHVALTLSLHMNERGGSCYPGTRTLADETGLNRDTVRRALLHLEETGWLQVDRPERQGRGQKTHYTATDPERAAENAPSEKRRGLSGEKARTVQPKDAIEGVTSPNGDGLFESFYQFWTGRKYTPGIQITKSMRGRLNAAVKEARLARITPDQVLARGKRYVETWREMERTPQALLANWHRFEPDADIPDCDECENRGLVWVDKDGQRTTYDDPGQTTAVRCPSCTEAVNA